MEPTAALKERANAIRKHVLRMVHSAKSSHVGTSFSAVEILTALYFGILQIDPKNPTAPNRDRFILSKGHGITGLLATLAERGFFDVADLVNYAKDGSRLAAHVTRGAVPGAETSGGSGGHGLGLGVGMALAARQDGASHRIFVLMGDGEMEEGSVWEAIMFAGFHKLDNLTLIIDNNHLQILGRIEEILATGPFEEKLAPFGWEVEAVDGHDFDALIPALEKRSSGRPRAIVAQTVKGKGVSFMENKAEWHVKHPNDQDYEVALKELSST